MMDTLQLLEKSELRIKEIKKQFETDEGRLKELKELRGNELANELLESKPEHKEKIAEIDKEIAILQFNIESSPLVIDGLKRARLKLMSQKEKEEKEKALKGQAKLEISLNSSSQKLVVLLKEVIELNRGLKIYWEDWDKLDEISGKGLTDKKTIRPSVEGIDKICGTLISEWAGCSDGTVRKFYSKDRFRDTRLIF